MNHQNPKGMPVNSRQSKIDAMAAELFARWMTSQTNSFTADEIAKRARAAAEAYYRDDREQVTK